MLMILMMLSSTADDGPLMANLVAKPSHFPPRHLGIGSSRPTLFNSVLRIIITSISICSNRTTLAPCSLKITFVLYHFFSSGTFNL